MTSDPTWEEPTGGNLEARLERLERMASGLRDAAIEEGRLTAGVERLGDSTEALTRVLTAVDEQARTIARVDKRTADVERSVEDERHATAAERRRFLRKAYLSAALAAMFALVCVVGGAWLTDKHLQDCVLHGPSSDQQRQVCNTTFPGHDHPKELSLDALLARGAVAQHQACLNVNERTKEQITLQKSLLVEGTPAQNAARLDYITKATALLQNCDKTAPLPTGH